MEVLEEAVQYFKNNNGYLRLLKGLKNKYISYGEIKGNVVISNPTDEEKQALSGLMKRDYSRNKTININIAKLQKQLQTTRFSGIDLKDFINAYFNEEIVSKKDNKIKYQEELDMFFEKILRQNEGKYVYKYLKKILENKNNIYYNLKKYYNKEKDLLGKALNEACAGINNLPEENIRIPVFASNTINNPHGYDKKTLCGKIFIMLLSYINGVPVPKDSENLAELYYNNHLLVDDVSNMVLCKNITGFIDSSVKNININKRLLYVEHKGLQGFKEYNEPIYLTIYNLSNISSLKKDKYQKVLITENPAVFMEITEKCKKKDFKLICTYGQVKLAGIILLDLLTKAGYKLYYSGDIDPEGIQIADKLKQRYGKNLEFIGFDVKTYLKNISKINISEMRIKKLKQIKSKELLEVCKYVAKNRKAAYEEENIENLITFLNEL